MKLPKDESCLFCLEGWDENKIHKLKGWLKESKERHLAVIDRDPTLLLRIPKQSNIRIFIVNDQNEKEILRQIAWQYLFLPLATTSKKLQDISTEVNGCAADFADTGLRLVANARENLKKATLYGRSLFGELKGVPAIVCGAGPSLSKNGRLLQEIGSRALVIAGGAAVESLRRLSVTPHFAAHVDPDPDHPFLKQISYDIPLFYQLRTSHEVVAKGLGPKLLIEGTGNFPLESWAQKLLGMSEEPFDGGWTVGCFSAALAFHLGCDPIVFVGMDLQGERYDWSLAAKWIEQFANNHPSRKWINATEGGVGFQGIENLPLSTVLKSFQHSYDIKSLVEKATPLTKGPEIAQKIEESIFRAHQLTTQLLQDSPNPLAEHELDQEIAEQKILHPIWEVWKYPILRHNAHGEMGQKLNRLIFAQDVYGNLSRN